MCLEPHPLSATREIGYSSKPASPDTESTKGAVLDLTSNPNTVQGSTRPITTLSSSSSFSSTSSNDTQPTSNHSIPANDSDISVDVFPPWDIQSIQNQLGGRYDRETIVDMLQKCRGDIDRAFAALIEEQNDSQKKIVPVPSLKPSFQVSRSSSPFSTGSKRSADDSEDSEDPRPAVRRGRPRKRLVSNLTLGVGISFTDDQNEVVSLNLRVSPSLIHSHSNNHYTNHSEQMKADAEKAAQAEKAQNEGDSEQSEASTKKGPRRSGRLSSLVRSKWQLEAVPTSPASKSHFLYALLDPYVSLQRTCIVMALA